MHWLAGSDANLSGYRSKVCSDSACSLACSTANALSPSLTATKSSVDGTSYFACVQAEDLAANTSAWVSSIAAVTVQTSASVVSSVASPMANGFFKLGDVIPIQVIYSSNVHVTNGNDFTLTLETEATDRNALYSAGSGTNTLTFLYSVQAGDTASDLNYISAGALSWGSSGALKAASGVLLQDPWGTLKNFVIDTTPPALPSSVGFGSAFSTTTNLNLSWSDITDTNARYHKLKICAAKDCTSGCIGSTTNVSSPLIIAGVNGSTYYGCVQGEDLAGNVTPWVSSLSSVTIDTTLPTVTTISSPTADGFYKVGNTVLVDLSFSEPVYVTFGGTHAATLQKHQVFYSANSTYGSFDLSNPIATINYGDAPYDATPTDTKVLVSVPIASLKDGYYYVRYYDVNGKYVDPNRSVSSIVSVLKGTPGYTLIPKKFSSLAYDYYIMRYEASLSSSGSNAGGDTVTTTSIRQERLRGRDACAYANQHRPFQADLSSLLS
ncbi:MAG: hypothetical protein H7318_12655 [Oligoflexus sp.]|nr:hypothetical protein [Oligoflexus sp.]